MERVQQEQMTASSQLDMYLVIESRRSHPDGIGQDTKCGAGAGKAPEFSRSIGFCDYKTHVLVAEQ